MMPKPQSGGGRVAPVGQQSSQSGSSRPSQTL
jgi:hypothetical protein